MEHPVYYYIFEDSKKFFFLQKSEYKNIQITLFNWLGAVTTKCNQTNLSIISRTVEYCYIQGVSKLVLFFSWSGTTVKLKQSFRPALGKTLKTRFLDTANIIVNHLVLTIICNNNLLHKEHFWETSHILLILSTVNYSVLVV